jgi:hypothetical protein
MRMSVTTHRMRRGALVIASTGALLITVPATTHVGAHGRGPAKTVYATGLDNPRGLTFGPDGRLYGAEAGLGGTDSTVSECPDLQIGPPFGPYTNGPTARVSRIDRHGRRTTVIDGLPSGQSTVPDWQGVASVAFIGKRLFALVQGGGCSYGSRAFPKSIIEVDLETGGYETLADLGAFRRAHPPAIGDDDLETEGVFFSMAALDRRLYVVDTNSSAVLEVRLDGSVRHVVDFTRTALGHIAPTAITAPGTLLVGNLFQLPIADGASSIYHVSRHGHVRKIRGGFTAIIGLTCDRRGRLYVLEAGNGKGSGFPDPEAGRVVRVFPNGRRDVVAAGLTFPTAITLGPDGRLYVSNRGFDTPPQGTGEIVAIDVR